MICLSPAGFRRIMETRYKPHAELDWLTMKGDFSEETAARVIDHDDFKTVPSQIDLCSEWRRRRFSLSRRSIRSFHSHRYSDIGSPIESPRDQHGAMWLV